MDIMKIVTRWSLALILALLGILTLGLPVSAQPADPTTLVINEVSAYENALAEGDQLYLVMYTIHYATLPVKAGNITYRADELFIFRLLDGTTEVTSAKPFPFYNNGFGLGVVAFYLDPEDAPTWESSLTVELTGDPLAGWIGTPPQVSTDVISWTTGTTGDIQEDVSTKILVLASRLQQSWDVTLLATVQSLTVLNEVGQTYFAGVVPYLNQIAPYAMGSYTFAPDFPGDKPSDMTYAAELEEGILDTLFDVSAVASSWGMSRGVLTAVLYYAFVVVFFVLLMYKAGMRKGMMLLLWPFVIGGAFFGVPLVVTILGGFACLMATVWVFYKAVA